VWYSVSALGLLRGVWLSFVVWLLVGIWGVGCCVLLCISWVLCVCVVWWDGYRFLAFVICLG